MQKERWVWVKGYESHYQISDHGRVMSYKNYNHGIRKVGKLKIFCKDRSGYIRVGLYLKGSYKTVSISRLVAQAFILNPGNKPEVNHINGRKANNYYTNLEWCSKLENMYHAKKVLRRNFHPKAKTNTGRR